MPGTGPPRPPRPAPAGASTVEEVRQWIAFYDSLIRAHAKALRRMRELAAGRPEPERLELERLDIEPLERLVEELRSRRALWVETVIRI